jgi:hypothetical protein
MPWASEHSSMASSSARNGNKKTPQGKRSPNASPGTHQRSVQGWAEHLETPWDPQVAAGGHSVRARVCSPREKAHGRVLLYRPPGDASANPGVGRHALVGASHRGGSPDPSRGRDSSISPAEPANLMGTCPKINSKLTHTQSAFSLDTPPKRRHNRNRQTSTLEPFHESQVRHTPVQM